MKSKIEILEEQNSILRDALQNILDFQQLAGNCDIKMSHYHYYMRIYKSASEGIKKADNVQIEDLKRFFSSGIFASVNLICEEYKNNKSATK